MKRIVNHFKRWNCWRKINKNGSVHKLLVLFNLIHSPTFNCYLTEEEMLDVIRNFRNSTKDFK